MRLSTKDCQENMTLLFLVREWIEKKQTQIRWRAWHLIHRQFGHQIWSLQYPSVYLYPGSQAGRSYTYPYSSFAVFFSILFIPKLGNIFALKYKTVLGDLMIEKGKRKGLVVLWKNKERKQVNVLKSSLRQHFSQFPPIHVLCVKLCVKLRQLFWLSFAG